jgi:hypothetical protein
MESGEQPIISEWHQGERLADSLLGAGYEAEVHRRTFNTESGEHSYAYKELDSEKEAIRVSSIYSELHEAGLPVVSFLKTTRTITEGKAKYGIAMEDVTEGGRYDLFPIDHTVGYSTLEYANHAANAQSLKARLIESLAVMHNREIYDFHPGISFFLRVDKQDPSQVDFRILDYSNLTKTRLPDGWDSIPYTLKGECLSDLKALLRGIASSTEEQASLTELYDYYRAIEATQLS